MFSKVALVVSTCLASATATAVVPTDVWAHFVGDFDYNGGDIGSTQRSSPDECIDDYQRYPGTNLFTWTDHEGGTCWMKTLNTTIEARFNPGSVSGVFLSYGDAFWATPSTACALEGDELDVREYTDPRECTTWCLESPECSAITRFKEEKYCKFYRAISGCTDGSWETVTSMALATTSVQML